MRREWPGPSRVMLAVAAVSGLVLLVLLALGWGGSAIGVAAGVLVLGCAGACWWTWKLHQRAARDLAEQVRELARRRAGPPASPGSEAGR